MIGYVTAKPCHVSVPCFEIRDLGGAEWSCRCCSGPAFERVTIFLTSLGHLTSMVHHVVQGFQAIQSIPGL
jgi:hypothetical protein